MPPLFQTGQILKGALGRYTIRKQVYETVWFASNQAQETVVVKSVTGHPRVENERNVLKRFQHRTPFIRPLLDEIQDPATPTTIALKYLESDLLKASIKRPLSRKEIKYVSRRVLEALKVLHEDDHVHTDVKLDNVFVNFQQKGSDVRFSDVQLGDLGGCYPADSEWATSGTFVGTPMWSSPEMLLNEPWNTATDIWSFGTVLISLIYGDDFNIFRPKGFDRDHEEYALEVWKKQYRWFGPFPAKYKDLISEEIQNAALWLMNEIPVKDLTPFQRVTEREVVKEDKEFICRIMKLDWRDRPFTQVTVCHKI